MTVKLRLGWNDEMRNVIEQAQPRWTAAPMRYLCRVAREMLAIASRPMGGDWLGRGRGAGACVATAKSVSA